jgi:AcrR family transcriptional regulator
MATQSERLATTRAAILKTARLLFGDRGFENTTIDDIAIAAGVAKGAIYHHFKTKEALFEAVFTQVSLELATDIARAARTEKDVLLAMAAGTQLYFAACAKKPIGQIILRDGPAVLGWDRWRKIDMEHFGGQIPHALSAAMEAGLVAKQPVEPLARLLLGAMTEAAVACAGRTDIAKAGAEYGRAFKFLLEMLRVR